MPYSEQSFFRHVRLEEPLFIVEKTVHVALQLSRGSSPDETQLVRVQHTPGMVEQGQRDKKVHSNDCSVHHSLERNQRFDAQVLATVLQACLQVRQETEDRPFVYNTPTDTLGHTQLVLMILIIVPTHRSP